MNKTEKKPDKPGGACKHCPWGKRIHQRLILCMFPACVRGEPKREEKTDLAGCFNPDKLTVKDSYTMTEADKDALRMRDIVLLPVVEM